MFYKMAFWRPLTIACLFMLLPIVTPAQDDPTVGERATGAPSSEDPAVKTEEPPMPESTSPDPKGPGLTWNLPMKTLGGRQLWSDVRLFHQYRIQQHVVSEHFRLLDGGDVRLVWGTLDHCLEELDRIKQRDNLKPMSGKAVILIHGIVRSSKSMNSMLSTLEESGYLVLKFDYPSTRVDIPTAAQSLHEVISHLDGVEEINLVVHSMGGLIVRAYLKEYDDERLNRMVMMAVPNRGARLASMMKHNMLYKAIYGPAGQQLISEPDGLIASLPTPKFEFAVIAGARGTIRGYNPLVPGDDDGTVSVASTRLPGATDFMTIPAMHSFLMTNEQVVAATNRFLTTGALRVDGDRHPIPTEDAEPESAEPKAQTGAPQTVEKGTDR